MSCWQDVTNYPNDKTDGEPTAWELEVGEFCLRVHRHKDYPGKWLTSCSGLFYMVERSEKDIKDAKAGSILMLRAALTEAIDEIDSTTE